MAACICSGSAPRAPRRCGHAPPCPQRTAHPGGGWGAASSSPGSGSSPPRTASLPPAARPRRARVWEERRHLSQLARRALGGERTVWCELVFADPISDLAVLAQPDDQVIPRPMPTWLPDPRYGGGSDWRGLRHRRQSLSDGESAHLADSTLRCGGMSMLSLRWDGSRCGLMSICGSHDRAGPTDAEEKAAAARSSIMANVTGGRDWRESMMKSMSAPASCAPSVPLLTIRLSGMRCLVSSSANKRCSAKVCICNAAIFIFGIWFAYQLPRVRENYMPLFGGIFGGVPRNMPSSLVYLSTGRRA